MSWLKAPDTAATIPAEPLRTPVDTFMRVHISVGASKPEPFAEYLPTPPGLWAKEWAGCKFLESLMYTFLMFFEHHIIRIQEVDQHLKKKEKKKRVKISQTEESSETN